MARKKGKKVDNQEFDDGITDELDENFDFDSENPFVEDTSNNSAKNTAKAIETEPIVIVDAKVLLSEIQKYYDTGYFSSNLADMIYRLAENMARRSNFSGYSWKDEMILDGYEKMAMAIYDKKFDIAKNYSPFSYLSRICWRSFVLRIKKEKQIKEHEKNYREVMYEKIKNENTGLYYNRYFFLFSLF